eukprot:CAMPEP_0202808770 /NCGR_PEP_ID=MMETSP1389-20130828/1243_1 /ASSEMBLY_ACC=CAM_ASM_000865 /TAXON_ID=302021 /ORGANISM="Rhodomonas sp., Strain CCMP768" /LENGTH=176 /DNA_ID=CAMNT_0049479191 /DNA_START=24 /DNA_END=554 /DNA_ORIENTATION=+
MAVISYGTVQDSVAPAAEKKASTAVVSLKIAGSILMGLMAAALVAAMVASQQETPNEFKSELASFTKLQLTRLEEDFPAGDGVDGVDADQEGDGYECCWHAPNENLASTSVASKVGPNGWGAKPDADGSVPHYENALGEVPEWVFKGEADHEWKDYDGVFNQEWYQNTYPSGESGI